MSGTAATFDSSYVTYWRERTVVPTDGSKVADLEILNRYLSLLRIGSGETVLDLGCGLGRLFPALSRYTRSVIGMDLSPAMLEEAARHPYLCLVQGTMEDTRLAGGTIDHVVTWATFDVVEQEQGLVEANRILKEGGTLLVTGKNLSYPPDDEAAFVAERNAKLKDFPNHFTDVSALLEGGCREFGFEVREAFAFLRRGHLGEDRAVNLCGADCGAYYEYLLVLGKSGVPSPHPPVIAHEFSSTASKMARDHGFGTDVRAFFAWDKARGRN